MSKQERTTGLLLPSREVLLWAGGNLAFLVDAARSAESAGFDSVWVGDSLLARPRGEPLVALGAIAGATSRVTLGTAVLLPLLRHPVALAHALASLDRLSKGRLIVGVGPGAELPGTHAELAAVGVPSDRRAAAAAAGRARRRRVGRDDEAGLRRPPPPCQTSRPPPGAGAPAPPM